MSKICLFAGTSEGRRLAEAFRDTPLSITVCVATEYGETLIPQGENIKVHTGRLDRETMNAFFAQEQFSLVVDATHPYAVKVTENIALAALESGVEYLRLTRGAEENVRGAVYVDSIGEAADYLKNTEGKILLTTGSKELLPFTEIPGYEERIYARVLPMKSSLEACEAAGIKPAHIIALQGPFSEELNRSLIHMTGAKYLVTKDSGLSGGFPEKVLAAEAEGVVLVVIGRPAEHEGMEWKAVLRLLKERYQISPGKPKVNLIGIGVGSERLLTRETKEALERAECIIGAKRAVEACAFGRPSFVSMDSAKILEFIRMHPEYREFGVVMTGDTGFFSGTKKLLPLLREYEPIVYPGISSLQYLCGKLGVSWDDACILSLHGREGSAVPDVRAKEKVFVLVGGAGGAKRVLEDLCKNDLGEVLVSIGERLSYPDEKITTGTAKELSGRSFDPLSVLWIQNRNAQIPRRAACLPDEAFLRNTGAGTNVPMTKAEVRAISVAKLMLESDSVVYDIGAGTGSVSVEMAGISTRGRVYAVECKPEAAELAGKNKKLFGLSNLIIVEGTAPEACKALPAPTHAFIGGTSGNMEEILRMLLEKNPEVRIVMNLIALESIAEAVRCLELFGFDETEVVQVSVAKARKLGRYRLMNGQNPILVITCQKHPAREQEHET